MSFVLQNARDFGKQYLRLDEVALAYGVTKRSVQRWMESGRIAFITTPSGHRRIPLSALAGASANYQQPL